MEFSTHYLLMADHAMLQKLVMSRIKPLGLTTGQPKVLDFLQDHDGHFRRRAVKGVRTVYVRLTDLGREQCRRLNAIFAAAEEEALRGFSPQEMQQVQTLLERIYHNLNN